MSVDLNAKLEELGKAFEQFKEANDKQIKEVKEGRKDAVLEEKIAKTNQALDKITEERDAIKKEIEAVKTAMNRPGNQAGDDAEKKAAAEYKKAYGKYLRKGVEIPSELKTVSMSVDSDDNGGYLVSPEMGSEIVKKVFESSPIRQLASVVQIQSDAFELMEDLDEAGSGWVAERGSRSVQNSPQLKKIRIPTFELYSEVQATQKILDDAAFDVEAWIAGKVSDKFSRDEATAFVQGDGLVKPKGFADYANGTSFGQIQQVGSGSSGAFTADGLFDIQTALKEPYQANAAFLLQRASVGAIRKLKDSQNRYLLEPGLNGSKTDMLMGKSMFYASDMAAIAGGALALAYGDFKAGYQIVDRIGIRSLRDPYTSKPNVLFYITKRVGGDVKNFEAIKLQVLS